jgi:hypothetical protein
LLTKVVYKIAAHTSRSFLNRVADDCSHISGILAK